MLERKKGPRTTSAPILPSTAESSTSSNNTRQVEYVEHPLYGLYEVVLQGYDMVHWAGQESSKRGCIAKFKTAAKFLNRTLTLIPWFQRIGRADLTGVASGIKQAAVTLEHYEVTTLVEGRQVADDVKSLLDETTMKLSAIIVADEDRMYPGCRNGVGELVVGGVVR